jgi:hypothetical protein
VRSTRSTTALMRVLRIVVVKFKGSERYSMGQGVKDQVRVLFKGGGGWFGGQGRRIWRES